MNATKRHETWCLECCGGGKLLRSGGKRECEREATAHSSQYRHAVTVVPPTAGSAR